MSANKGGEERHGVPLTNLDQPLFDEADATKRDLIDYLDAVADWLVPELADRPLSVIRVHRGQEAFMQKNLPDSAPDWIPTYREWAESAKREVHYALVNEERALIWFGNQRAVEFHPGLLRVDGPVRQTFLVLDLDPPVPGDEGFRAAVAAARLVRSVLHDLGLDGMAKTSGATGVHVYVPIDERTPIPDVAATTRAIAARAAALDPDLATTAFLKEDRGGRVFVDATRSGGATVVAAYSPRVRPGAPVSFPVAWDDLDEVFPRDFNIRTVPGLLGEPDSWSAGMARPQRIPAAVVDEGHAIPIPRVQAMHEGKRRRRQAK